MLYCIDTSAILDGRRRYYPAQQFPTLWSKIEDLADSGMMYTSESVISELQGKDDEIYKWAKQHLPVRDITEAVESIIQGLIHQYPAIVDESKNPYNTDPSLIALAQLSGNTVIVTGERLSAPHERIRIPNICRDLGISYVNLIGLMERENWSL